MLEEDYRCRLSKLLSSCTFEIAVPREWRDVVSRSGVIAPIPADQRRFVRYHFASVAVLELQQTHPSVPRRPSYYQVLTRDLSRTGIAFLHREQLFPGERAVLWLPHGKEQYTVVRCRRHNASAYEIGAALTADE